MDLSTLRPMLSCLSLGISLPIQYILPKEAVRMKEPMNYWHVSFYLGVTEVQNFFRLSDCRTFSFSSSLNCLGMYWVKIFL